MEAAVERTGSRTESEGKLQEAETHTIKQRLQDLIQQSNWVYGCFWKYSKETNRLTWEDGYYNGLPAAAFGSLLPPLEVHRYRQERRRIVEEMQAAAVGDAAVEDPMQLYKVSDELEEMEWFYLMSSCFDFSPSIGIVGRTLQQGTYEWLEHASKALPTEFVRQAMAEGAGVQTIVCVAVDNGVVELASTLTVSEDMFLVQAVKTLFASPTGNKPPAVSPRSVLPSPRKRSPPTSPFGSSSMNESEDGPFDNVTWQVNPAYHQRPSPRKKLRFSGMVAPEDCAPAASGSRSLVDAFADEDASSHVDGELARKQDWVSFPGLQSVENPHLVPILRTQEAGPSGVNWQPLIGPGVITSGDSAMVEGSQSLLQQQVALLHAAYMNPAPPSENGNVLQYFLGPETPMGSGFEEAPMHGGSSSRLPTGSYAYPQHTWNDLGESADFGMTTPESHTSAACMTTARGGKVQLPAKGSAARSHQQHLVPVGMEMVAVDGLASPLHLAGDPIVPAMKDDISSATAAAATKEMPLGTASKDDGGMSAHQGAAEIKLEEARALRQLPSGSALHPALLGGSRLSLRPPSGSLPRPTLGPGTAASSLLLHDGPGAEEEADLLFLRPGMPRLVLDEAVSMDAVGESVSCSEAAGPMTPPVVKRKRGRPKKLMHSPVEYHCQAERQRRIKENEQFETLRGLVPTSPKATKAKLLGDVVSYLLKLHKKMREAGLPMLDMTADQSQTPNERATTTSALESTAFPAVGGMKTEPSASDDEDDHSPKVDKKRSSLRVGAYALKGGLISVNISCQNRPDILMEAMGAVSKLKLVLQHASIRLDRDNVFRAKMEVQPKEQCEPSQLAESMWNVLCQAGGSSKNCIAVQANGGMEYTGC